MSEVPMQPLIMDGKVVRFKSNKIVVDLLDLYDGQYMNEIAMEVYTDEDRMQFAQLIGYSVSGYGDLSYVSDESYERAENKTPATLEEKSARE